MKKLLLVHNPLWCQGLYVGIGSITIITCFRIMAWRIIEQTTQQSDMHGIRSHLYGGVDLARDAYEIQSVCAGVCSRIPALPNER